MVRDIHGNELREDGMVPWDRCEAWYDPPETNPPDGIYRQRCLLQKWHESIHFGPSFGWPKE